MMEEMHDIPKLNYDERARNLCMDFCYYERELEVYSEIEGLQKAINGYTIGQDSHRDLRYRGRIASD